MNKFFGPDYIQDVQVGLKVSEIVDIASAQGCRRSNRARLSPHLAPHLIRVFAFTSHTPSQSEETIPFGCAGEASSDPQMMNCSNDIMIMIASSYMASPELEYLPRI